MHVRMWRGVVLSQFVGVCGWVGGCVYVWVGESLCVYTYIHYVDSVVSLYVLYVLYPEGPTVS